MGLLNFFKKEVLPIEHTLESAVEAISDTVMALEAVVERKASSIIGIEHSITEQQKQLEAHKSDLARADSIRNKFRDLLK